MSEVQLIAPESPSAFDYSKFDPETAQLALRVAEKIRADHRRTIKTIINTGIALRGIKDRLGYGHFGAWIEAEFGWNERTAQRFMAAAEAFRDKTDSVSDLSPTTIYALAAPSTPSSVRDDVITRRGRGEHLPVTTVRNMISAAKHTEKVTKKMSRLSARERKRREEIQKKIDRSRQRQKAEWAAAEESRRTAAEKAAKIIMANCRAELPILINLLGACPGYGLVDAIRKAMWLEEHPEEAVAAGDVPKFVMGESP